MIKIPKLKKLFIDQYLLHEVQHHEVCAIQGDKAVKREPRAHSLVDIYKCLHQGEFGVGHLIDDADRFRYRLLQEMLALEPTSNEPILENVSIENNIMRLNLRPFRALYADDVDKAGHILAEVCIQSTAIDKGDTEHFFSLLKGFQDLNHAGEFRVGNTEYSFPTELVEFFLKEIKKFAHRMGEIPVLSHSSNYRQLNKPSYRVVDVSVIRQSELASLFEKGPNSHLHNI
jgi:hypothetical protein